MTWGTGPWGKTPHGGASAAAPTVLNVGLAAINVFALDLIELVFDTPVKRDDVILSVSNYQMLPFDPTRAVSVEIRKVTADSTATIERVYVSISPFTVGEAYDFSVLNSPVNSANQTLVGTLTRRIIGRRTKIDSLCSTRPAVWDLRSTSVLRNVLNAIGREDDLIGGNQNEGEEIIR